jgi:hypothetical protein
VPVLADPARQQLVIELAAAMPARRSRIGAHAALSPPAWAMNALGPVPGDPLQRLEWTDRASAVGAYCLTARCCCAVPQYQAETAWAPPIRREELRQVRMAQLEMAARQVWHAAEADAARVRAAVSVLPNGTLGSSNRAHGGRVLRLRGRPG